MQMNNIEILKELNSLSLYPDKDYQKFLELVSDYKINLSDKLSVENVIEGLQIEFDNIIIPERGKTGRVYANGMTAIKVQELRIERGYLAYKNNLLVKYLDYYDMLNVSIIPPANTQSDTNDYYNNKTGKALLRTIIDNENIDITAKADKKKKWGNQKWEYTGGEIYRRIRESLGQKLGKDSALTEIKNYRGEKLKGKSK